MTIRSYVTSAGLALGLAFASLCLAAEANWPVPPNLRPEGIPPVPLSLVETLARYTEARPAVLQDWHPTRREILITTRFGDVPQVHRVAMPGGARTQLTFYPERIFAAHYEPKNGESFVFLKDVSGNEFFQIYLYDISTGGARLLTDGKSRNLGPRWSHSGRMLSYNSTRRNGRDTDIYVVDPSDPGTTRRVLEVQGGGWVAADWSPDDKSLLVEQYKSVTESALYLVNALTGEKELLTPAGPAAAYRQASFAPDGKGLYLTTDADSEFHRLAYMDLASRKISFLRPDLKWDVKNVAVSRDGRRLAYVVNEDGAESLHVMDLRTKKDITAPKLPYGTMGAPHWHNNGRDLAVSLSSARSPSDVYSIDVETGQLERWTTSETGGLNPENFVEPEIIRWKSFDGLTISGFLYRPPKKFSGARPVIINIHGGPEGQSQAGFLTRNNYYINELGVALIYPNVRGSTGYGKTFSMLDNGIKREDSVKDIGTLLDWIATRRDLDAGRVMVTGGSYGGYMTLASAFHFNDRLRCSVDVVGVSNFVTLLQHTESYRRDLRRAEYGDERDPKMRDFFMSIAPANHADRITKPMMIVAGRNDPRVPVTESEQMAAAIRKNGGPVWYLVAEDEGHGFQKKRNQDYQFAATVMFVKQHLLGGT